MRKRLRSAETQIMTQRTYEQGAVNVSAAGSGASLSPVGRMPLQGALWEVAPSTITAIKLLSLPSAPTTFWAKWERLLRGPGGVSPSGSWLWSPLQSSNSLTHLLS